MRENTIIPCDFSMDMCNMIADDYCDPATLGESAEIFVNNDPPQREEYKI